MAAANVKSIHAVALQHAPGYLRLIFHNIRKLIAIMLRGIWLTSLA